MIIKLTSLMLGMGTLLLAPTGFAQTQRSGGGETQKVMQQYQQLAAEKTALQGQLAQAQKDLDSAKADLAAMKKERDALKAMKFRVPLTVAASFLDLQPVSRRGKG